MILYRLGLLSLLAGTLACNTPKSNEGRESNTQTARDQNQADPAAAKKPAAADPARTTAMTPSPGHTSATSPKPRRGQEPPDVPRVSSQECAGYPMAPGAAAVPAPNRQVLEKTDINSDDATDLIVAGANGGSELYINCGDNTYYLIARSAAKLQVTPRENERWASFTVAWEEERTTEVAGRLYRLDLLPFTSDAPVDFALAHHSDGYSLPLGECRALGINAPRYRIETPQADPTEDSEGIQSIRLELNKAHFRIDGSSQEEYAVGDLQTANLNNDSSEDAVLYYGERYGSGRTKFGAILLGCGDGSYVVSGRVDFGQAGPNTPKLTTQKMSICGKTFIAFSASRYFDNIDSNGNPEESLERDLYLYRPTESNFFRVVSVPAPGDPTFAAALRKKCDTILRQAETMAPSPRPTRSTREPGL